MTDADLEIRTEGGRVVVSVTALSEGATQKAKAVAQTLKDEHGAVEQ